MGHSLRKKKRLVFSLIEKYNIHLHLKIILLEELSILQKLLFNFKT